MNPDIAFLNMKMWKCGEHSFEGWQKKKTGKTFALSHSAPLESFRKMSGSSAGLKAASDSSLNFGAQIPNCPPAPCVCKKKG